MEYKMPNVKAIQAELREGSGKGAARALRRTGQIPAIIYGGNKDEVKISTNLKEFFLEYSRGNFRSKIFDLQLGKEKIRVLPRDVQLHPVTDVPVHADFYRVENDTQVHVFVKVRFLNTENCPGLKRGGVLNIVRREIELICRADSIPTILEVDLGKAKVGDSIHSHSITYPEGVHPAITTRDFTVAVILGRTAEEVEEEVEAPEGEEAAEGEEGAAPAEGAAAAPAPAAE
jgi:large subunit ribosomal protein L25